MAAKGGTVAAKKTTSTKKSAVTKKAAGEKNTAKKTGAKNATKKGTTTKKRVTSVRRATDPSIVLDKDLYEDFKERLQQQHIKPTTNVAKPAKLPALCRGEETAAQEEAEAERR